MPVVVLSGLLILFALLQEEPWDELLRDAVLAAQEDTALLLYERGLLSRDSEAARIQN